MRKSGFYFESSTSNHEGLNLDELFESLNINFGNGENSEFEINMKSDNFLDWIMKHPQIILATLLISFGLINLCTCCCCCCWCCKRKKEGKKE